MVLCVFCAQLITINLILIFLNTIFCHIILLIVLHIFNLIMPVSCAAYGCTNRYKPGQTIHFFRFPLANVDLNKKWIAAIKRKKFTPTKWSRLCSDHFVSEDYQLNTKNVFLKKNTVPTVFSAFPSYYQKASKVSQKEPFVRNRIQIKDSNFNAADISNPVENDIPLVVDKVGTCNEITLVDDRVGTSEDITLVDDKVETSDEIILVDDEVGTSDEIVLTTNNKEVQTVNTCSSELFLKKKIRTLQQKLRRKDIKIHYQQGLLNDLKTKL
ncbi:hypothetical protein ACI65C_002457 [Semiaphis heraclei]